MQTHKADKLYTALRISELRFAFIQLPRTDKHVLLFTSKVVPDLFSLQVGADCLTDNNTIGKLFVPTGIKKKESR